MLCRAYPLPPVDVLCSQKFCPSTSPVLNRSRHTMMLSDFPTDAADRRSAWYYHYQVPSTKTQEKLNKSAQYFREVPKISKTESSVLLDPCNRRTPSTTCFLLQTVSVLWSRCDKRFDSMEGNIFQ